MLVIERVYPRVAHPLDELVALDGRLDEGRNPRGVDLVALVTARLIGPVRTINQPAGGGEATSDLAPAAPSDL